MSYRLALGMVRGVRLSYWLLCGVVVLWTLLSQALLQRQVEQQDTQAQLLVWGLAQKAASLQVSEAALLLAADSSTVRRRHYREQLQRALSNLFTKQDPLSDPDIAGNPMPASLLRLREQILQTGRALAQQDDAVLPLASAQLLNQQCQVFAGELERWTSKAQQDLAGVDQPAGAIQMAGSVLLLIVTGVVCRRWWRLAVQQVEQGTAELQSLAQQCASASASLDRETDRRVVAERRLRLFSEVTNRSSQALIVIDALSERVVFANEAFQKLSGAERSELDGSRFTELLRSDEGFASVADQIQTAIKKQQSAQVRLLAYNHRGQAYWAERQVRPILDERGQCTHFLLSETDITQQREAELEWQRIRVTQEAILNGTDRMILVLDANGCVQMANAAVEQTLGYRQDDLRGYCLVTLLHDAEEVQARRSPQAPIESPLLEVVLGAALRGGCEENEWTWMERGGNRLRARLRIVPVLQSSPDHGFVVVAENVSRTLRREQHAHSLRETWEAAQRLSHMGTWEIETESGQVSWSGEMDQLLEANLSSASLPLQECLDSLVPPGDHDLARQIYQAALDWQQPIDYEVTLIPSPGQFRSLHVVGEPVLDAGKKVTRVRGFVQDISARKQIEAELQESRRFSERILAAAPGIVFLHEPGQTRHLSGNRSLSAGLVVPGGDAACGWLETAMHLEDRPGWEACLQSITDATDEEVRACSFRMAHRDGGWRWLTCHLTVFSREQDGRAKQWLGVAVDVTARVEAEQALHRSQEELEGRVLERTAALTAASLALEQEVAQHQQTVRQLRETMDRYSLLSEAVPQLVRTARPDGKIEYGNTRCCEYLGITAEHLAASSLQALLHEEDRAAVERAWEKAVQTGQPFESEHRLRRASDGADRWHLARALPRRNETGEIVQWFGTFTEIHDQKQAESLLQQSQEELERQVSERTAELQRAKERAEAAANAKSQFLATMSHELRTPLNGVLGMTNLLLETELTPEQKFYGETAHQSGQSLLTIIKDILDFSKMESEEIALTNAPFALKDFVNEAIAEVRHEAQRKELGLSVSYDPTLFPVYLGDSARLHRVLTNLLDNAVKFTETGRVCVRITGEPAAGAQELVIRVEVEDTGIGIAREVQERLFACFTQADSSNTRRYGGTGLGLAICKRLIMRMGGQIGLRSTLSKGSLFWFTVPLPVAAEEAEAFTTRILLVSAQPPESGPADWLSSLPRVEDTPAALAHLSEAARLGRPFTAVLVESSLPAMSGPMLALGVQSNRQLQGIQILLIGEGRRPERLPQEAAPISYLQRPLTRQQVEDALKESAGHSTFVTPRTREARGRVLVAEDNITNQKVSRLFLARLGCEVDLAGDGAAAVEAVQTRFYDLVLMDCQMPEMDGYEATGLIRRWEQGTSRHTPIVALTANVQEGEFERCLAAGMDDYLAKPVRPDQLSEKLDRWLPAVSQGVATRTQSLLRLEAGLSAS